jgi:UDP-N-acetylmuramate dehydrogenase
MNKNIRDSLGGISAEYGGSVVFTHRLSSLSSIGIGGEAAALYGPSSEDELKAVLKLAGEESAKIIFVGSCSNILFPDAAMDAVVIRPGGKFAMIEFDGARVTAGAGVKLSRLIRDSSSKGLSGFEGLSGIPATVGGALAMNASYRGSISDRLERIQVMDPGGRVCWVEKSGLEAGYRHLDLRETGVILKAVFSLVPDDPGKIRKRVRDLVREKMDSQPLDKRTLGCIFKNPGPGRPAWELIDKAGMRGRKHGGAAVSEKHANFIVNENSASSSDVRELINEIKEKVKEVSGITLEEEIRIIQG